jgi:YD repeat-containing protein
MDKKPRVDSLFILGGCWNMSSVKRKSVLWLTVTVVFLCVGLPVAAQTNTTFKYFYDDLGQLAKVADSTGTVIEYVYDPVGNILQIKRSSIAPGTLAIINFTPQSGGPTQAVTIQGQGFGATPAANNVQFNGTAATVTSASPTTLIATVPAAATTGPIAVTVSGQTATSSTNFTVLALPVVVSLSRKSARFNTSFPNVLVTGINFSGATFAFQPLTSPPAIAVTSAAIDPTGTSVVLALKIGSQPGTFALVATSSVGSSSALPTKANRFTVVDPRSTVDTDGDGVPDAIEAIFGTDPLDPNSVPVLASLSGQAESPAFTVLNRNTSRTPATFQAESPSFTVLNGSVPPPTPATFQAESPAFTVLNSGAGPKAATFMAESPAFTVQNTNTNRSGTQTFLAESPMFSILNGSSLTGLFAAEGPLFSVKNTFVAALPIQAEGRILAHLKNRPIPARKQSRASRAKSAGKSRKPVLVSTISSPQQTKDSALGRTTKELNDQQGVMYDNQHK